MQPFPDVGHEAQQSAQSSPLESPAQNPCLFVVGCPRSGTTLLQRMLDSHPHLAVANDTHFIPRALEQVAPQAIDLALAGHDIPLTEELVQGVWKYHRFARLGLSEAAVREAAAHCGSYRGFVGALYFQYARLRGKPTAGEKTPDYVRRLPLLHVLFPWAKFVHLIRDGRDVALSLLDWATPQKGPGRWALWSDEPLAVSALWWKWQVNSGCRAGRVLQPSSYLEVRYEQIVAHPAETLACIAAFLNLPFAPEMLAYYEGKLNPKPGRSAKGAWLPPTQGLRDWRTQMNHDDLELFEALAGDLLSELGYPRGSPAASPAVAARARACAQWWNEEMERREGLARQSSSPSIPSVGTHNIVRSTCTSHAD